jgi:hypothetical protein
MFSLQALKKIGPGNRILITWSYFLGGKGYVMFQSYFYFSEIRVAGSLLKSGEISLSTHKVKLCIARVQIV